MPTLAPPPVPGTRPAARLRAWLLADGVPPAALDAIWEGRESARASWLAAQAAGVTAILKASTP